MRTARLVTSFITAATLATGFACSDSAKPLGTGDMVTDDTAGQDASQPQPPPVDSGEDSADGYGPAVIACAGCSCDPTLNYCFSGASSAGGGGAIDEGGGHRPAFPLGGFGEPDGAAEAGPPPPPCPVLAAGAGEPGCLPLPSSCAATPTCVCLLTALQGQYPSCYLDCSPTPGFLSVYCSG